MLVRVYQPVGDQCRIVRPNPRHRHDQESEADFLQRVCAITEAHDPTLAGLPFVDVADDALPRERTRGDVDVRAGWRIAGNRVTVDEAKVRRPQ